MCAALTPDQLDELEALLDQPDHDLYAWIVGRAGPAGVRHRHHERLIKALPASGSSARQDLA